MTAASSLQGDYLFGSEVSVADAFLIGEELETRRDRLARLLSASVRLALQHEGLN